MPIANRSFEIVQKAGTNVPLTTSVASTDHGLLQPYQAQQFLTQTFEKTVLTQRTRTEIHREQTGVLPKLTVPEEITRKKIENTPPSELVMPQFSSIPFTVTPVRVAWAVTNEMFRQNIEGEGLEAKLMNMLQTAVALDRENLCLNGDEDDTSDRASFIGINDGWIKQIRNGGHVVDASGMTKFYYEFWSKALMRMPPKYDSSSFLWIMNPLMRQAWEGWVLSQAVEGGGHITDKRVEAPTGIPILEVPKMPPTCILLLDPKNLIQVCSYNVIIKRITQGWTAQMNDKRGYVIHYDFDAIIENLDSTLIIDNIPFETLAKLGGADDAGEGGDSDKVGGDDGGDGDEGESKP